MTKNGENISRLWIKNTAAWPADGALKLSQDLIGVSMKYFRRGWDAFSTFVSIKVSDGSQIRFWHEIWCEDHPLNDSFSELFYIARDMDALGPTICLLTMTRCIGM